jgi:hypothetical protein
MYRNAPWPNIFIADGYFLRRYAAPLYGLGELIGGASIDGRGLHHRPEWRFSPAAPARAPVFAARGFFIACRGCRTSICRFNHLRSARQRGYGSSAWADSTAPGSPVQRS